MRRATLNSPHAKFYILHTGGEMPGRYLLTVVLAAAISVLGSTAWAQENQKDDKNEVAGVLGRIFISDQGIQAATFFNPFVRSGKGLTFEINYARHFYETALYGLSAEVDAAFNLDEDLNSGADVVPKDYRQIFFTPALRLNLFPDTAVSPWVSFGGGFAHFSENSSLIYGGANPGGSNTSGVLQGGVGLDVRPFQKIRRFAIRGEARDFWSGTPDLPLAPTGKTRQHNYLVGGGAVWHF
jgi:hypothetical protein